MNFGADTITKTPGTEKAEYLLIWLVFLELPPLCKQTWNVKRISSRQHC